MEKHKDIFYFSSTHWDREWYQTFHGFRYRLVDTTKEIIETLENRKDFGIFHFDGQTIVLDDFAEIEPEMAERLKKLIQDGKIKVGPWYVMPDEFLLSGESLIRNLIKGHSLAKEWGAKEPWKNGYICDIFGHIAQMPQIFNGFGINNSLFCRGYKTEEDAYFIWQAPDGSECINFRAGNRDGYGEFCLHAIHKPGTAITDTPENVKGRIKDYMEYLMTTTRHPVYVVMDGFDHAPIHPDTAEYIKEIERLYPEARVHHTDLNDAFALLGERRDELDVVKGEMNFTGKTGFPQLISNTLSSYYPIKKANDRCQNRLEKIMDPLLVYSALQGHEINKRYIDLAYKNLLQNHPHDSICGCSIDQVHKDVEHRFDEVNGLCDAVLENYIRLDCTKEETDGESDGIITLYNTLPFEREEVVTVDLLMKSNYPATYQEPFGYELINSFRIKDSGGNEIPYQVINIKRNYIHRVYAQIKKNVDVHTVMFKATLPAGGKCEYRVVPSETPVRYLQTLTSGADYMENSLVRVYINQNGTVSLLDKKTGKMYDNLLSLVDDGEIGDGWFHANPKCDRVVYSQFDGCKVEKIESGVSRCVFRITKTMSLPKRMETAFGSPVRSEECRDFTAVFEVGLSENSRYADVKLTVDNNVCDHRLRLALPTGTDSDSYFAGQAFYCCRRSDGIDYAKQDWYEPDIAEKAMNGIVGKRGSDGCGLAFVSAEGLHECASVGDEDKTLYVTLLRGFKTTVLTNGETRCQLMGEHVYKFVVAPLDEGVKYSDLVQLQDRIGTEVISVYNEVACDAATNPPVSHIRVSGRDICTSAIKRAEREDAYVVRVFNASDSESEAVIDFVGREVSAKAVNLNEEEIDTESIAVKDGRICVKVTPWHIVTVMVNLNR